MAKQRIQYQPLSGEEWHEIAAGEDVRRRISDDVILHFHPHLVRHFSAIKRVEWHDAVTALHCVLSWMQSKQPIVSKLAPASRFSVRERAQVLRLLRKAHSNRTVLTEQDLNHLMRFTNNSSIGLSKLLHFFAPSRYPIWDTWVASVFFTPKPKYDYTRKAAAFVTYQRLTSAWARNASNQEVFGQIRRLHPLLKSVPRLRLVELVLWHYGKSRGTGTRV